MTATHAELENLYVEHANGKLGEIYLPEAIRAETAAGRFEPVLCHISHVMVPPVPRRQPISTVLPDSLASLASPTITCRRIESFKVQGANDCRQRVTNAHCGDAAFLRMLRAMMSC